VLRLLAAGLIITTTVLPAPPEHYRRALSALLRDAQVDSVIAIFIPPLVTDPNAVATAIAESTKENPASRSSGSSCRPLPHRWLCRRSRPMRFPNLPRWRSPASPPYGQWRERPVEDLPPLDRVDPHAIQEVVETILQRGGGWSTPEESLALLTAVGIETAPHASGDHV
jgi:acyl-CoA synthetase (NDP forming)